MRDSRRITNLVASYGIHERADAAKEGIDPPTRGISLAPTALCSRHIDNKTSSPYLFTLSEFVTPFVATHARHSDFAGCSALCGPVEMEGLDCDDADLY